MPITLTPTDIDAALPKIEGGLAQYLWLQTVVMTRANVVDDTDFRRRFNHFYRVRRNAKWQAAFYALMAEAQHAQMTFPTILDRLYQATNRYEASFASKLVATLTPTMPVIDSMVLVNVGLRLPPSHLGDRAASICGVYDQLVSSFAAFHTTDLGQYLVQAFTRRYPDANVTPVKMLDFVLWQTRP